MYMTCIHVIAIFFCSWKGYGSEAKKPWSKVTVNTCPVTCFSFVYMLGNYHVTFNTCTAEHVTEMSHFSKQWSSVSFAK